MKRAVDLDGDECNEIFSTLPLATKRQLLDTLIEPTDARVYRNVLTIIIPYASIQTWGRIRQCCRLFHETLLEHPFESILKVQLELPPPQPYTGAKEMFFAVMRRVLYHLRDRDDVICKRILRGNPNYDLFGEYQSQDRINIDALLTRLKLFEAKSKMPKKDQSNWFRITGFRVLYPSGFIFSTESFRPIGNIFCDPYDPLFEEHPQWRGQCVLRARFVNATPRKWYTHCKAHVEQILKRSI